MEIKDYIHLYFPCQVVTKEEGDSWLIGITDRSEIDSGGFEEQPPYLILLDGGEEVYRNAEDFKLVLRPLSDMTNIEAKELYKISPYSREESLIQSVSIKENIKGYQPNIVEFRWAGQTGATGYGCGVDSMYLNKLEPKQTLHLLKNRFDIFGLIEARLVVDATKM